MKIKLQTCNECFHYHESYDGSHRCEITGNTVTKKDFCSRAEDKNGIVTLPSFKEGTVKLKWEDYVIYKRAWLAENIDHEAATIKAKRGKV